MTDGICLHKSNLKGIFKTLSELTETGKRYRIRITEWRDLRTIPMNRTWRMWIETTGDWLRARGVVIDIKNGLVKSFYQSQSLMKKHMNILSVTG